MITDQHRDWMEDFDQENGNYFCRCQTCNHTFRGHKRRITCRSCVEARNNQTSDKPEPEEIPPRA